MIGGSLSPRHGASSSCGWRYNLQIWRLAANILNNQPRTNEKGRASSPGNSNIYPTRCNVTQFIYIWKLLYIFRVVPPPIIRSTQQQEQLCSPAAVCSCCCVLLLLCAPAAVFSSCCVLLLLCALVAVCSWWWVEVPPETCRAVSRYK